MNLTTTIENDELATADASATDIGSYYEAFKRFLAEEADEPASSRSGDDFAFSNRHCKTDHEAEALHRAFLREVLELTDEDF